MATELDQIKNDFVEKMGFLSSLFGFNSVVGRLYGLLYLSPEPLCMDDMAQEFNMSKGNICMNLKELEKWGAVKKVWVKGSRKDFYEAETDFKKMLKFRLKDAMDRRIHEVDEACGPLMSIKAHTLSDEDKELARFYQKRAQSIKKAKKYASIFMKGLDLV